MRTWVLLALALLVGLVSGIVIGREWSRQLEWRGRRVAADAARRFAEPEPEQRQRDSMAMARFSRDPYRPPREIRRMHAFGHCVITFEMQDTSWRNLQLMNVRAQFEGGAEMRRGFRYDETGYDQGEIASVVLPNLDCSRIRTIGFGASLVLTPEQLARMRTRSRPSPDTSTLNRP